MRLHISVRLSAGVSSIHSPSWMSQARILAARSETGTNSGSVGRPGSQSDSPYAARGGGPLLRGSQSGNFTKQVLAWGRVRSASVR